MYYINKFYKQKQYEGDRLIDEKVREKCENKLRKRWKDRDRDRYRYVYQYLQNNIMKYLMTVYLQPFVPKRYNLNWIHRFFFIDTLLPINGQAYSLQPKGAWWLCLSFHIEGPQPPQSHTVLETPVPLHSRWNSQSLKKGPVEMSTISPFFHTSKLRDLEMFYTPLFWFCFKNTGAGIEAAQTRK